MIERLQGRAVSDGSPIASISIAGSPTRGLAESGRSGRPGAAARRAGAGSTERLLRAALVGVSLSVVVAALEVGLRLGEPDDYRSTGVIGASPWGGEPDFRAANAAGPLGKREGVYRILTVGDSVTWGSGVHAEDAYPVRLARRLRGLESGREVEVVSWSRNGWNTHRQWRSLEDRLDLLEPDLLILGYSLNDPEPDRIDVETRSTLERRRPRSMIGDWLFEHSRLFGFVHARLENTRQRRAADAYYQGLYDEAAPARRLQVETLETWAAAMRRRGVAMVVVIFPMFETQLDADYPYAELHRRTAALAGRLGVPVLDLLPRYAGVDARRLAVEPFTDSHPNELAHRMAADAICEWLFEKGLVPVGPPAAPPVTALLSAARAAG